jgi:hypothetical protein
VSFRQARVTAVAERKNLGDLTWVIHCDIDITSLDTPGEAAFCLSRGRDI